jgi:hypothetical protein
MQISCEGCGQLVPGYDVINCGSVDQGYEELCGRCFNSEVAKLNELDGFESPAFRPVVLADSAGRLHELHFRSRLLGNIVSLEALEIRDGSPAGYQFQIIGDPHDDALALLGRLIERMRRALSIKHLEDGDHGLTIAEHQTVRGRIDWDEKAEGRVPLLVIDGREITWKELGHMLMTFEGIQFKLQISDRSEEV